jgi:hypothetical protein
VPRRFTELATRASKEAYKLVGGEPGLAQIERRMPLYVGASVVPDDYRQKISASRHQQFPPDQKLRAEA